MSLTQVAETELHQEIQALRARIRELEAQRDTLACAACQQRYCELIHSLTHGIQEYGRDGTILYSSPSSDRLSGHENGGAIGKKIWDSAASEEARRDLRDHFTRLAAEQAPPTPWMGPARTRQGGLISLQIDWDYKRDAEGRLIGIVSLVTDVTERLRVQEALIRVRNELEARVQERTAEIRRANDFLRQEITERERAEEALRESQQMLQLVLDSIPVRVFWKDRNSNYLGCNRPFARDAGVNHPDEIIGRNDYELPWRRQAELYRGDDAEVIRSGVPKLNYEEPQTRPDGTHLRLRTSKVPLRDLDGQVIGVMGCHEDITELKRAEERLHQAERLASVGMLAAGIAHEINNPIGTILLAAQTALEFLEGRAPSDPVMAHLIDIAREAKRCGRIVKSVLQFARREKTEKWSINLNAVAARAMEEVRRTYAARGVRFGLDLWPQPIEIIANPIEIEQVLVNLIQNAAQAEGTGLQVTVRTRRMPHAASVQIEDNGPGMMIEQKAQAFDPFFTTRRSQGGTGLGLSVVQGIVSGYGGTLDIESVPGGGARITVELPRSRPPD